ncbi:MAG: hypothetical protein LBD02_00380 [Christensenellaceae bacterium]|jgi:hypothetical protein|nr:hypothetical protein [Christensenellaceae bacterium]
MQEFTALELSEAQRALLSTLRKCQAIDATKLAKPQRTLLEGRVAALTLALALIERELHGLCGEGAPPSCPL